MKVTELQLGDIVKCSDKGIPMQVVGLFKDVAYLDFEGNEGDMWEVDEEDLRPIPITPEILEKNEFVNEEKDIYVLRDDPGVQLFITDLGRGAWGIMVRKLDGTFILVIKEYVHELQHALKLCNIKKEIEL